MFSDPGQTDTSSPSKNASDSVMNSTCHTCLVTLWNDQWMMVNNVGRRCMEFDCHNMLNSTALKVIEWKCCIRLSGAKDVLRTAQEGVKR